jgi:hypothetical protein
MAADTNAGLPGASLPAGFAAEVSAGAGAAAGLNGASAVAAVESETAQSRQSVPNQTITPEVAGERRSNNDIVKSNGEAHMTGMKKDNPAPTAGQAVKNAGSVIADAAGDVVDGVKTFGSKLTGMVSGGGSSSGSRK